MRFWRSEVDGPQQMRGGAGKLKATCGDGTVGALPDETCHICWRAEFSIAYYILSMFHAHTEMHLLWLTKQIYRPIYGLHSFTLMSPWFIPPLLYVACSLRLPDSSLKVWDGFALHENSFIELKWIWSAAQPFTPCNTLNFAVFSKSCPVNRMSSLNLCLTLSIYPSGVL